MSGIGAQADSLGVYNERMVMLWLLGLLVQTSGFFCIIPFPLRRTCLEYRQGTILVSLVKVRRIQMTLIETS